MCLFVFIVRINQVRGFVIIILVCFLRSGGWRLEAGVIETILPIGIDQARGTFIVAFLITFVRYVD